MIFFLIFIFVSLVSKVFFLPVTRESALRVIEKEKPDSILVSMGGQTALNVGVKLFESGDLAKHGVRVLGTQIPVIIATEDRELFSEKLEKIGETLALSFPATTVKQVGGRVFWWVFWLSWFSDLLFFQMALRF